MDARRLEKLAATWPGVTTDVKWDDDLIFSVGRKMFCGLCLSGAEKGKLSFKVEPERFLEFTDRPGFRPAPYMARCHWVTLDDPAVVPVRELEALLRRAYELVRAGLTQKLQREYAAMETGGSVGKAGRAEPGSDEGAAKPPARKKVAAPAKRKAAQKPASKPASTVRKRSP